MIWILSIPSDENTTRLKSIKSKTAIKYTGKKILSPFYTIANLLFRNANVCMYYDIYYY